MYTKILVPLDGSSFSEQILPYARVFAEAYGIPLKLLRVNDPDIRPPFWPQLPGREYLKQVAGRYLPASLRIDHIEESGKPAEIIVDRAKSDPACLIAMATHGLSGARRWLLGSVASKVAHTTTNPLLFIRPAEGQDAATPVELKTVFVPLDGSGLAEKILPHVIALAKTMKLEVHLLRVYMFAYRRVHGWRWRLYASSWTAKGGDKKSGGNVPGRQGRGASGRRVGSGCLDGDRRRCGR
jgi:nucleotide-binding universal stress UspA family protein